MLKLDFAQDFRLRTGLIWLMMEPVVELLVITAVKLQIQEKLGNVFIGWAIISYS